MTAKNNKNEELDFEFLKGYYVLIVNTASNCGYTEQYKELQTLHEVYKNKLKIVAFPSNDFKHQEPNSNSEISQFCTINYGIQFAIMEKSNVLKNDQQSEVYKWLSSPKLNGWNNKTPSWNFCKYLIGPNGILISYYDTGISPLSKMITNNFN